MKYAKYVKYAYITAIVLLLIYFAPSLLHLFMPFILAFLIAAPCHKLVELLNRKLHIHRGISSTVIFILIIGSIGALLGLLIYYIIGQVQSFLSILPNTIENLRVTFSAYYEKYRSHMPSVVDFIENYINSLGKRSGDITTNVLGHAADFATSIPSALFFALIFLLSVFFFIKDYGSVMAFFSEALPEKLLRNLRFIKNTAWRGFLGYVKSQLILSSITALLVAVTFWIIGIDYSVVWGLIVGIIDAFPILGSGIVLVPYAIIHFMLNKNLFIAICVIILQIVAFMVRQILSPRVMSSQLGLHPIITLISIYVGNEVMGVMGMIIFPIIALLAVSLYNAYKDAGSLDEAINKSENTNSDK